MPYSIFRTLIVSPIVALFLFGLWFSPWEGRLAAVVLITFVCVKSHFSRFDWFMLKWGFKFSIPLHVLLLTLLLSQTPFFIDMFGYEISANVSRLPVICLLITWLATCFNRKPFGISIARHLGQFNSLKIHIGQKIKAGNGRQILRQIVQWAELSREMGVAQIKLETPNQVLGGDQERNNRLKAILSATIPGVEFEDVEEKRSPFMLSLAYLAGHGKEEWERAGTFRKQCQLFRDLKTHGFVIHLRRKPAGAVPALN